MKSRKNFFVGLITVICSVFIIISNVGAAPSDKVDRKPPKSEWVIEKQNIQKGGQAKAKKEIRPKIQPFQNRQNELNNDNSDFGKRKDRPEKSDSLN